MFIAHLPQEAHNQRYTILAPSGDTDLSLREQIDRVLTYQSPHFDLSIFRNDTHSCLRVIPETELLVQDPVASSVYHIERAVGYFVDEDGRLTLNRVDVHGFVNTEVTASNTPAGFLVLWHPGDMHEELKTLQE